MKRRKFIRNISLCTGGVALFPHIITNTFEEEIILGHNHKQYRIDTKWGILDNSQFPVKDCHEMVIDQEGRIILLTNETRNNVLIYDRSGKLLESWGTEYPGAHGLTLFDENGTDTLFICDNSRHQVIKTDIKGRVLMTLDYPVETGVYTSAEQYIPTETAIARNGDIYVADGYGLDFIIQYDRFGNYIRHFGGRGVEERHLLNAHGICFDYRNPDQPSVIVSSRQQQCFKRFSLDGQYLSTIPVTGAWVCRPVIKGDYLYAAVLTCEAQPFRQSGFITILDKDDRVISNPGGNIPVYNGNKPEEMYQTVKAFCYPHDVCIDDEDNIYVAQWNSGQVYPYKLSPV